MTRIIVIGNSHVAALKTGWEEIAAEYPGVEMEFFAAPGYNFVRFHLWDGLNFGLTPEEAARPDAAFDAYGRPSVDLSGADVVIRAGLAGRFYDIADLMRGFDIEGLRETGAPQILSRAAFDAFCAAIAEGVAPGPEWRGWDKPRLFLLPAPIRSADCIGSASKQFRRLQFLGRNGEGAREVVLAYFAQVERVLAGLGFEFIPHPAETLLPNGLTDTRFARGPSRFADLAPGARDMTHMNGEYGKLRLRAVFDRLGLAAAAPEAAAAPLAS